MSRKNALRLVLALIVAVPSILGGYLGSPLIAVLGGLVGLGIVFGYAMATVAAEADRRAEDLGRRFALTADHAQEAASALRKAGASASVAIEEAVEGLRALARSGLKLRTHREGALLVAEGHAAVELGSAHERALVHAYNNGTTIKTDIPRLFGRSNGPVELQVTGYQDDPRTPGYRTFTLRSVREAAQGAQGDENAVEDDTSDPDAPEALSEAPRAPRGLAFDFAQEGGSIVELPRDPRPG